MGQRVDHRGEIFFFRNYFVTSLGIHLSKLRDPFRRANVWRTNLATFEGLFIHQSVVEKIGYPDPKFFITWDDLVYGWLASMVTDVVCVNEVVLRRLRNQKQISLGVRHLSESSDLTRFYMMRNRAIVAHYLKINGRYNKLAFACGTVLVLLKEVARVVLVERRLIGLRPLVEGLREAKVLLTHWS